MDAVGNASGSEVALALLLLRLVLPVSILAGVVWAHIRISRALQKRLDLPADMKATLSEVRHEIEEFRGTLGRHISKDAAREQQRAKAEAAKLEAMTPGVTDDQSAAVPGVVGGYIPSIVWNEASEGQRAAWQSAGLRSA